MSLFSFWGIGNYLVIAHQVKFAEDVGFSSVFATTIYALFGIMSIWMLYNYVNGFEPYYKYDVEIIAGGFLLGLVAMNGFVIYNMRIARREGKYPARQLNGLIIFLAFLVPYLYYILLVNPAGAWRFSIGFFFSALITPLMVKAYESIARGRFFIQEEEVEDKLTRTLVFRS